MKKKGLAEIIGEKFGVSQETIEATHQEAEEKSKAFREILLDKKILTESQLLEALNICYGIPVLSKLPVDSISSSLVEKVSIQFLKKYVMVPLASSNPGCLIALNDPMALQPLDDLVRILEWQDFQLVLAKKDAILSAINLAYNKKDNTSTEQLVADIEQDSPTLIADIEETADLLDDGSDAPIIKLVNHIISQSAKARASDIHIEPYQQSIKIRYRIDGVLYDMLTPPKWVQASLISRIKVMAKLNIAEKRLPQDGRIDIKIGDQNIDVRVSTLPTAFGERVVLRLLNKSGALLQLGELGMLPQTLKLLENLIKTPNGIMLVTGPTGSGKTTTLYAALASINTPGINIITIEDPVEYQIEGISQIQVNPKIDLTFAKGLRSIVRQDPDVILVGEIRDRETADIAIQAALTGHLVFSTLHTNDAAGAITRLVDIGAEPFLISSSLIGVVAQRLIRLVCHDCKEAYKPDGSALRHLGIDTRRLNGRPVYKARGCSNCLNIGYNGRNGIFEIMVLGEHLKTLILKTHDANRIREEAIKEKMLTLRRHAIHKMLKGLTTVEEVLRVSRY